MVVWSSGSLFVLCLFPAPLLVALESKAKQLVGLAEKYTSTLAASTEEGGDEADEDQKAINSVIMQLGIANPIQRKQFKTTSVRTNAQAERG